jgi:putative oxidoreductase
VIDVSLFSPEWVANGRGSRFWSRDFMSSLNKSLSRLSPDVLSILRIISALLFLAHGTGKFLHIPMLPSIPASFSMSWWGGVLELVGGLMLAMGLFTRPVAFILSGEMAVAYFTSHAPKSFFPTLNGGDAAVLFCFVFLYFLFSGPGPWSVDAWRERNVNA